jgi:hypothetical protein
VCYLARKLGEEKPKSKYYFEKINIHCCFMKKIRGHNKFLDEIENSIETDSKFNLNDLLEKKYLNYDFDFWYYEDKIITNGKSRKFIIENLIKIYYDWENELKKINKKYYLAIWLCEPRLLKSEVVCAIDERINFYEMECFKKSENQKKLNFNNYGILSNELGKFEWERKIDFEIYFGSKTPQENYETPKEYFKDQRLFKKLEKENYPFKVDNYGNKNYYKPVGDIWIGK